MKFVIISVLFHVCASIALKFGAVRLDNFTALEVFTNVFYLLALSFLFLQALIWQQALRYLKLGQAYLYSSFYYPFILFASYFVFDEKITTGNIVGTLLIVSALFLAVKSRNNYA